MKKYLAIIAVMLFVLGFAATAFALHAEIPAETTAMVAKGDTVISIGGALRFRGFVEDVDFNSDTNAGGKYDGRVRLHLDAKVAKNVQGFIQLETGLTTDPDFKDTYTWGQSSKASGVYQKGNAKRGDLQLLQAWIQYKPLDNLGVKVGHMPLALGNKIFFNHTKFGDDAILAFWNPAKDLHIFALTAKFSEGQTYLADDSDAYVAAASYSGGSWNISGDVTYVDDQTAAGTQTPGVNQVVNKSIGLWNLGARGDISIANFTIRADGEFQFGSVSDAGNAWSGLCGSTNALPDDCDFKGYAWVVGVDAKFGNVKLTLDGGQGSGDDDATDDEIGLFVTSLGAHLNAPMYTYAYDYRTIGAAGLQFAGIVNTTFARLAADAKITPKLSVHGQFTWLKATEDVALGGAVDALGNPIKESDLGYDISAKATYKLAKNLKYWVEGGMLFAGDAYDRQDPNLGPGFTEDADDVWSLRKGIQLSF